jgi:hypothetical protein
MMHCEILLMAAISREYKFKAGTQPDSQSKGSAAGGALSLF